MPVFDDLLAANAAYVKGFDLANIPPTAAKGIAVVTCMDTRIEPLGMLGLVPGDAKILRNAGARISEDALRSLILATSLLGVDRIAVVQHTDCAMTKHSEDDLRHQVEEASGTEAADIDFLAVPDQLATLRADVERVRACPQLKGAVTVAGFIYDVRTGALDLVIS